MANHGEYANYYNTSSSMFTGMTASTAQIDYKYIGNEIPLYSWSYNTNTNVWSHRSFLPEVDQAMIALANLGED